MSLQTVPEVRFALQRVHVNEQYPSKWTAIDAIDAVCAIPLDVFAKKPRLRNVCLMKIMEFRFHPKADDDVLEALERLRVVLEQALEQVPWVADEEFDFDFRAAVGNPDLVFDGRNTETSLLEAFQTAYASEEEEEDEYFREEWDE
jgi:hypothetical protein